MLSGLPGPFSNLFFGHPAKTAVSSKFAKNSRTQSTPRVCKPPPPAWRWVPLPSYQPIHCRIYWKHAYTDPADGKLKWSVHDDRFIAKYTPAMHYFRVDLDHNGDFLRLVLTPVPAEKYVAIVCGFWVTYRLPISDHWNGPHMEKGNYWYTRNVAEKDPWLGDYRIIILNT